MAEPAVPTFRGQGTLEEVPKADTRVRVEGQELRKGEPIPRSKDQAYLPGENITTSPGATMAENVAPHTLDLLQYGQGDLIPSMAELRTDVNTGKTEIVQPLGPVANQQEPAYDPNVYDWDPNVVQPGYMNPVEAEEYSASQGYDIERPVENPFPDIPDPTAAGVGVDPEDPRVQGRDLDPNLIQDPGGRDCLRGRSGYRKHHGS